MTFGVHSKYSAENFRYHHEHACLYVFMRKGGSEREREKENYQIKNIIDDNATFGMKIGRNVWFSFYEKLEEGIGNRWKQEHMKIENSNNLYFISNAFIKKNKKDNTHKDIYGQKNPKKLGQKRSTLPGWIWSNVPKRRWRTEALRATKKLKWKWQH